MKPIVEFANVTKSFGRQRALAGVDLAVDAGEIVGFVGPNGAGKSTCLRICIGVLTRDGGMAQLFGLDPSREDLAIRRRCAYLPGETSIYHQMTGTQFLDFALHGYGRATEVLGWAPGLFELPLRAKIRSYSAGMKQRLALRATLLADVGLFILDEPDRALDATARMELREVLIRLRARGSSVLLSSHHLSEVEAIADRSVFLLDGACVPDEHVVAAREYLRREVRLRLEREFDLPDGYEHVEQTHDGCWRVRVAGDPLAWLARVPSEHVVSAEVGATRLEDLYRQLTERTNGTR